MKWIDGDITTPKGFRASGVNGKIKNDQVKKEDLMVIESEVDCDAVGVFTRNKVVSGSVQVCKETIHHKIRGIVALSGIANTALPNEVENAKRLQALAGDFLQVDSKQILLATTGKIGKPLDLSRVEKAFTLLPRPDKKSGRLAARAIMTSDSVEKVFCVEEEFQGVKGTMGLIGKGSGMIHPDMGTTLSFITTDINIDRDLMDKALKFAVDETMNMMSVDGDTSTNDTCLLLTSGLAKNPRIEEENEDYQKFLFMLIEILRALAKKIAGDGEGATKLIIAKVSGAKSREQARKLAKSIIVSDRFKASMTAYDGYWGRILSNMGCAGVDFLHKEMKISYLFGKEVFISYHQGKGYDMPDQLKEAFNQEEEVMVHVELKEGNIEAEAYGCNLTEAYVRLVIDYR